MTRIAPHAFRTAAALALLPSLATPPVQAAVARDPVNRVAIILDASGSYRGRQAEALHHALTLLEDKRTHTQLDRWATGGDELAVISLDALPEILWRGNAQDLKREGLEALAARFRARTDYAGCTDVGAAFQVAARFLEGDPAQVHPMVIAYSDLIDEKPASGLGKCRKPERVATDTPWEAFRNTPVNVLWLPPDQKLAWRRAAETHGWTGARLFTVAESPMRPSNGRSLPRWTRPKPRHAAMTPSPEPPRSSPKAPAGSAASWVGYSAAWRWPRPGSWARPCWSGHASAAGPPSGPWFPAHEP